MAHQSGAPSPTPHHLLTKAQLRNLLDPLRRDYLVAVALTADLPMADRRDAITARLESYGEALGEALGDAVEEATLAVLGPRAIGGGR